MDLVKSLSANVNKMAFKMMNALYKQESNVLCSPFCAFCALSMVPCLFVGKTRKEVIEALISDDSISDQDFIKILKEFIENENTNCVDSYNKIWVNQLMNIPSHVFDVLHTVGGISVEESRFPLPAVDEINNSVKEATHGMIPQLIDKSLLDEQVSLAIINAVYFKSNWKKPFNTNEEDSIWRFDKNRNKQFNKYMYYEESEILYAKNDGFQMVSLPYKDGYSMIICLPKSYNPLDVTEDIFNQLKNDLSINNIRIIIPKFEISTKTMDIIPFLSSIGINKAISPDAECQKGCNFYISRFLQKARINVNEYSTEAAAASFISARERGIPPTFFACSPFFYAIIHDSSQTILFSGIIYDPEMNSS